VAYLVGTDRQDRSAVSRNTESSPQKSGTGLIHQKRGFGSRCEFQHRCNVVVLNVKFRKIACLPLVWSPSVRPLFAIEASSRLQSFSYGN
jgi:hypothetical protein